LFSGDCVFFSGAKQLLPLLENMDVTVLPGISSMSAFCAKCGISYENMRFISMHGMSSNVAVQVKMNRYCFFLLGGELTAAQVCQRLCDYGLGNVDVHIGMEIGYNHETILHGKSSDFLNLPEKTLTVMIVFNPEHLCYIPSAVPDISFIRGKIPMTKAEVRCNAVAAMNIAQNAVCWDVGCGTGSVSVEMAFRCPAGQVFSFDHKEDAVCLTEQNAHKFSCDNITAIYGKCPEILQDYPAPDVVFIGGSGGFLTEIFAAIAQKNPRARIVLAAVSMETLSQGITEFLRFCDDFELVQLAVTRTKKVRNYTMPETLNPVWLLSGGLQCSES
jgi:precorrin-6Y C5,15-methyltransferase (decarboxylating)